MYLSVLKYKQWPFQYLRESDLTNLQTSLQLNRGMHGCINLEIHVFSNLPYICIFCRGRGQEQEDCYRYCLPSDGDFDHNT